MQRFSMKVEYDPEMDPATWKGWKPGRTQEKWRKELQGHRLAAISAKRRPDRSSEKAAREEAEKRAEETVRRCVHAIRFALTEVNDCPVTGNFQSSVNVQQLHNVLHLLIGKCGVKFSDDEFVGRIKMDRAHLDEPYR